LVGTWPFLSGVEVIQAAVVLDRLAVAAALMTEDMAVDKTIER
jgi:hypothetical protein